jgi:hypothetical protein
MKTRRSLPSWFEKLLRDEGLDDLDQFFEPGYFDETSLYSRYDQLDPLGTPEARSIDIMLLGPCLHSLDSLLEHRLPKSAFFAALTMTRDERRFPMIPAVFACCGDEVDTISAGLSFEQPEILARRLPRGNPGIERPGRRLRDAPGQRDRAEASSDLHRSP